VAGKSSTGERNKRSSEQRRGQDVSKRKKRAMQGAVRRARRRQDKETSDTASGAEGKTSTRQRNDLCSERHGGQEVSKREKRDMQRASRWAIRQQAKETSDAASGVSRKTSTSE
jgi:hypothetical protein